MKDEVSLNTISLLSLENKTLNYRNLISVVSDTGFRILSIERESNSKILSTHLFHEEFNLQPIVKIFTGKNYILVLEATKVRIYFDTSRSYIEYTFLEEERVLNSIQFSRDLDILYFTYQHLYLG